MTELYLLSAVLGLAADTGHAMVIIRASADWGIVVPCYSYTVTFYCGDGEITKFVVAWHCVRSDPPPDCKVPYQDYPDK
jgi:hypothetical protein